MELRLKSPFPRSYWVIPNLFLAGEYPGSKHKREASQKIRGLLKCGIRQIINLMEENETNYAYERFVPYKDILKTTSAELGIDVQVSRYPIRDLSVPSAEEMVRILDHIDRALEQKLPVYVHCWGGVGRTGTVIGCYLIRHELANRKDVFQKIANFRKNDPSSYRASPETAEQRRMVECWLAGK